MDNINPLVFVVGAVAVAVTFATSLFKQYDWSPKLKHTVATVLSVVAGGVTAFFAGDFNDTTDIFAVVSGTYMGSQLFYNLILRGTSTDAALEAVGGPVNLDEEVDHVEEVVEVPVPAEEAEAEVKADDAPLK